MSNVHRIVNYTDWSTKDLSEYRTYLYRDRNKEEMYSERAELNQTILGVEKELAKRYKNKKRFEGKKKIPASEIKKQADDLKGGENMFNFGLPKGVIG
tara:strand:+ start:1703 stop:1996 length:294 start_codon:yes stop_codon:yes gene_type:complete